MLGRLTGRVDVEDILDVIFRISALVNDSLTAATQFHGTTV